MILGAIVDAGVDVGRLREALQALNVGGFRLDARPGRRGGVSGTLISVDLEESARRPRRWQQFAEILAGSSLSPQIMQRATAILGRLAEAEAKVHRTSPDDTQLHELGELDTLVDVVGSVVGLELLGVDQVYASPFPAGSGLIKSGHGILPVPSPATAALFAMSKAPVGPAPGNAADTGELVTPTGAAILTTLATFQQPRMNVERVGYGLGSRDSPSYPNALALWLGQEMTVPYVGELSLIETNIDDMSGELLGYVHERLLDIGARDVWFTPIQMKKNRPAVMMSAIVVSDLEAQAVELVLKETSTLGVRVRPLTRYEAERESVEIETSFGLLEVKLKRLDGKVVGVSPEFEACRRVALERGLPLQDVYRKVQRDAERQVLEA